MKIRAIGTGTKYARHPLTPACFLVLSGKDITIVGVPWGCSQNLEKYGYKTEDISIITVLSSNSDQCAGLLELATFFRNKNKKPILSAPAKLLGIIRDKIEPELGYFLTESFDVKPAVKIHIKEEYFSETISFIPSFLSPLTPSYALRFESSKVFITGETTLNEEWLFKEVGNDLIIHSCSMDERSGTKSPAVSDLQELPMYLQTKIWLYGYNSSSKDIEQPFPMMFLPPGSFIFDSERRDKLLSKDRFIRENSKKQV